MALMLEPNGANVSRTRLGSKRSAVPCTPGSIIGHRSDSCPDQDLTRCSVLLVEELLDRIPTLSGVRMAEAPAEPAPEAPKEEEEQKVGRNLKD